MHKTAEVRKEHCVKILKEIYICVRKDILSLRKEVRKEQFEKIRKDYLWVTRARGPYIKVGR